MRPRFFIRTPANNSLFVGGIRIGHGNPTRDQGGAVRNRHAVVISQLINVTQTTRSGICKAPSVVIASNLWRSSGLARCHVIRPLRAFHGNVLSHKAIDRSPREERALVLDFQQIRSTRPSTWGFSNGAGQQLKAAVVAPSWGADGRDRAGLI